MPLASLTQSHARFPLTGLLGSAGHLRVLRALATSGSPQSTQQLARDAGLSARGVRLVLESLIEQRVVVTFGSGRANVYTLEDSHPLSSAIAALFHAEEGRWERVLAAIRAFLAKRGSQVRAAWLYGSVARGEDTHRSDLDIALVVSSEGVTDQIREELMALEDEQQLQISLTGLTPQELAALPDDDPWWSDVVRDARILKGPAPEAFKRRLAVWAEGHL